jgi:hypothetical protein
MSKKFLLICLAIALCVAVAPAQAKVRNLYVAATDGYAYLPNDNAVPADPERKYYIRGFCDDVDGTQSRRVISGSTTSAPRAQGPTCGTATSRPPSTCRWVCTAG